jgi:HK97 family phage major capsid protein
MQTDDIQKTLAELQGKAATIDQIGALLKDGKLESLLGLPKKIEDAQKQLDEQQKLINTLRKRGLSTPRITTLRSCVEPYVSEELGRAVMASVVLSAGAGNHLSRLTGGREDRMKAVNALALDTFGLEQRAAMTTTEVPLPTEFIPQIIELVLQYGAARQHATVFPLGGGTTKLPRLKAGEDNFGFLGTGTAGGLSQSVAEKKVSTELVTFDPSKFGGLVRIPYELEEDTFVPLGQFLARYSARQLARGEDYALFNADGSASYAGITGVASYCSSNGYNIVLAAGKTKPSDATLEDFRNLRSKVSPAILGNMAANGAATAAAYYLHPTWEPFLRTFNVLTKSIAPIFVFENGRATFDGFPVVFTGALAPYGTTATPSAPCVVFGDLSYWYLGERGTVRTEVSKEVFFATDELAMRVLERITFQTMAIDAVAALFTAAQ